MEQGAPKALPLTLRRGYLSKFGARSAPSKTVETEPLAETLEKAALLEKANPGGSIRWDTVRTKHTPQSPDGYFRYLTKQETEADYQRALAAKAAREATRTQGAGFDSGFDNPGNSEDVPF